MNMETNITEIVNQMGKLPYHINSKSYMNWRWGGSGNPPLINQYQTREKFILPLFEKVCTLIQEHQTNYICGFYAQPSLTSPIGDILTEIYRQRKQCPFESHILFPQRESDKIDPQTTREQMTSSHLCNVEEDLLISLTLPFFQDIRPGSAMDIFLKNKSGKSILSNSPEHLTKQKIKHIILEDVLKLEFGLDLKEMGQKIEKDLILTIEKIIESTHLTEGIINFIAIPCKEIEDLKKSCFYLSLPNDSPIEIPKNDEKRKIFFTTLKEKPETLKFDQKELGEAVCLEGRLNQTSLTKKNDCIKVIRLTTRTSEEENHYCSLIQDLVRKILELEAKSDQNEVIVMSPNTSIRAIEVKAEPS